jgi:hypothetical protein
MRGEFSYLDAVGESKSARPIFFRFCHKGNSKFFEPAFVRHYAHRFAVKNFQEFDQ